MYRAHKESDEEIRRNFTGTFNGECVVACAVFQLMTLWNEFIIWEYHENLFKYYTENEH